MVKKVAAVVSVHPPKYPDLLAFLQGWQHCSSGLRVMDLMPIFTTQEDLDQFLGDMHSRNIDSNVVFPFIAHEKPNGAKYETWKKLDGLAQVLTQYATNPYRFVLMMDAEIGLNHCEEFGTLVDRLEEKQWKKVWYGDEASTRSKATIHEYIQFATTALSRQSNFSVEEKIRAATRDYKVFTWWTDLPFVEFYTGQRMFEHFGKELLGAQFLQLSRSASYASVLERLTDHVDSVWNAAGVNLTNVSVMMGGDGHNGMGTKMGSSFEHLLFQLYTVGYEGWTIMNLANSWSTGCPHSGKQSVNEDFWKMNGTDMQIFLNTVRPLWLPYLCDTGSAELVDFPILLRYHTDRWAEIGCNECRAPSPRPWRTISMQICNEQLVTGPSPRQYNARRRGTNLIECE